MKRSTILIAVLSLFLITSCAVQQQQPDPIREEIAVLQKQLLELQTLQNETRAQLDESNATINHLSLRLRSLDHKQTTRPISNSPQLEASPISATKTAADVKKSPAKKKKPAKKAKKKVRRQE